MPRSSSAVEGLGGSGEPRVLNRPRFHTGLGGLVSLSTVRTQRRERASAPIPRSRCTARVVGNDWSEPAAEHLADTHNPP